MGVANFEAENSEDSADTSKLKTDAQKIRAKYIALK